MTGGGAIGREPDIFPADMKRKFVFFTLAVQLFAVASLECKAARASSSLSCETIPRLLDVYLEHHLRFRTITDELRSRTADTYLKRLDPSNTLLLESEAAAERTSLEHVLDDLQTGDCSRLLRAEAAILQRLKETEAWVRAFTSRDDYAVDASVELVLDPEKRGRPATAAEREELQRKFVHFHVSNYLTAGTPIEEAKRKLVHRYELMTRRWSEQRPEDVYARFLGSFASSLDPHSDYASAAAHEDFQISMSLSLEGIGVALSSRDGYAIVEEIIPGGPTDRANALKPKDKIISVTQNGGESVNIIDMGLRDVVRLIRGKKGTPVHLTVLRQEDRLRSFNVTITRDTIDLKRQAAKIRYVDLPAGEQSLTLGVLELTSFYGDSDPTKRRSSRDVRKLLAEARARNVDGLLLDLSRNGGGILEEAVRLSGFFIRKGGIVAVKNGRGKGRVLRDPDDGILYSGPLVVLASRVSASASEILVGAMKDYQRAVLVGDDHTFGKGTVQTVTPLDPGLGALRYTTALFFRPGGESTQLAGVPTDIIIPSFTNRDDLGEQSQPYSLSGARIGPFLGPQANATTSEGRWTPVTAEAIGVLARKSEQRVAASEEFDLIRERLQAIERDDSIVRIAEILRGGEGAAQDGDASAADPAADGEQSENDELPQVREALNILADLVLLSR